jgi:hypothetical protein
MSIDKSMQIGSYIESLGIIGWDSIEPVIFAALKTRTPINLIGDKGTSKTGFTAIISRAVQGKRCKYQTYDTPNVTIDNVTGFLNLKKMEEGTVDFVKTGTSMWDKTAVTWDEISRANPMIQGKLLEAVRKATVHGLPTDVEFTFATCNPPRKTANSVGHDTYFLSEALAGRFVHIHVPESSIDMFDKASATQHIRDAFESNNEQEIDKYSASLQNLWLDFNAKKPTAEHKQIAHALVRGVLLDISKKGKYFDIRSALRAEAMVAEILVLNNLSKIPNFYEAIVLSILGNIAELNGIIRHDRSGDRDSISATIKSSIKAIPNLSLTEERRTNMNLMSQAFMMTQKGTLDEVAVSQLLEQVRENPNIITYSEVLTGLTRKQAVANDKYRSPNFRKDHINAINALLVAMVEDSIIGSISVKLPDQDKPTTYTVFKDTSLQKTLADRIHNDWYEANGFGKKK